MKTTRRLTILALTWLSPVLCAAGQQDAQDIPRDPKGSMAPVLSYPLPDGGSLEHAQYAGQVRRVDAKGKELARTKVPAAKAIASSTTLVLSSNLSRVLVLHRADDVKFGAKHRVVLLDMAGLKTLWEQPLGKCESARGTLPAVTGRLPLLCYQSQPPADPKRKPTFALVTIDLNRGEVAGWHALGGDRHGTWLGPRFLGWKYDVERVPVRQTRAACDAAAMLPADDPELVVVLNRDSETGKGDVWLLDTRTNDPPRRVALLNGHPRSAVVCTHATGARVVRISEDLRTHKEAAKGPVVPPASAQGEETIDLATGKPIGQQEASTSSAMPTDGNPTKKEA
jgi:hypothetical protein